MVVHWFRCFSRMGIKFRKFKYSCQRCTEELKKDLRFFEDLHEKRFLLIVLVLIRVCINQTGYENNFSWLMLKDTLNQVFIRKVTSTSCAYLHECVINKHQYTSLLCWQFTVTIFFHLRSRTLFQVFWAIFFFIERLNHCFALRVLFYFNTTDTDYEKKS